MISDASIRYTILRNIERASLSSSHASELEKLVREYTLELVEIPCLKKENIERISKVFLKEKKLLIIVPDATKFTATQTSNVNFTAMLINIEKSARVFMDMLKILTDMLTTIFISFSRGLVGFNVTESKEALRALAFVSLAKIYRPKGSISSLLSWGESLGITRDIGDNKRWLEQAFEETTICAIWQQALYLVATKRTVPISTINVLFRRKELLQICRDIENKANNLSDACNLEGVRIIYDVLNSFVGFASLTYKRIVMRHIAKQSKEYRKAFEDLLTYSIKNLL